MIKKRPIGSDGIMLDLSTDKGFIHRIGSDIYARRIAVRATDIDAFEWVADAPSYSKTEYDSEVERLIAQRYTLGQEIQFAREQESAGDKYTQYLAFVNQCKLQAKENLIARQNEASSESEAL